MDSEWTPAPLFLLCSEPRQKCFVNLVIGMILSCAANRKTCTPRHVATGRLPRKWQGLPACRPAFARHFAEDGHDRSRLDHTS